MKTIQKLFLLTVLGIGVYVHETHADNIQGKIRDKVNEHYHKIDGLKDSKQVNQFLATLKSEILGILNSEADLSERSQNLKAALERLNPSDKFSIANNIHAILDNLDPDIATTIKRFIPQVYKSILGL